MSLAEEVIAEAAPYLQDLEWAKTVIFRLASQFSEPSRLAEALASKCMEESDPVRRTDLRILLNYLRRLTLRG